jgi:cell division septal protein FtsQ
LGYVPVVLKVGLAVVIGILVFLGYRAAASASFFQVRNIETRGVARASMEAVQAAVRSEVSKTGVWRADLGEISARLEHLPWVRTATVSRVLPDSIRVRISEREPRVVVHTSSGRFVWVDEDAVLLAEMVPADQMPTFFLRGWNEDESPAARTENRERLRKFLELQRDWDAQGLSDRVSEVNLADLRDVRVQLAGDDSQIELRLGAQEHGTRLTKALNTLDKLRQTPRGPFISYLDLNQGKRVIVGLVSGGRTVSDETEAGSDNPSDSASAVARQGLNPASDRNKKDKGAVARNQAKADPKRR